MKNPFSRKERRIHELNLRLESRLTQLNLEERKLGETGRKLRALCDPIYEALQANPNDLSLTKYWEQVQHANQCHVATLTLLRESIQAIRQELEQARQS